MVIILQKPFSNLYRKGYLREDSSGRKRVDLVNSTDDRTTIAYARYLVCVQLGYILSSEYEVDHIDSDCSNDEISNLQVLTKEDHMLKTAIENTSGRNVVTVKCSCCGKDFLREKRLVRYKNQVCSHSCNGKLSNNVGKKALSDDDISYIRENFVCGDKEFGITAFSRKFKVTRNTVSKAIYDLSY